MVSSLPCGQKEKPLPHGVVGVRHNEDHGNGIGVVVVFGLFLCQDKRGGSHSLCVVESNHYGSEW